MNRPPAELERLLVEVSEMADRAIIVLLPETMTKSVYDVLYDRIEADAKAVDVDSAMVGIWPVGGEG